ncbi:MAG: RrF2 family transcriptional regulator [bacterium]
MQLSVGSEYAIHGLLYLGSKPHGEVVLLGDVADAIGAPESYLRKVFQTLSRRGLVLAYRGAQGGYSLSRPPEAITLKDIIIAIEGSSSLYNCLFSRRGCLLAQSSETGGGCIICRTFDIAEEKMLEVLEKTTLKDLVENIDPEDGAKWLKGASRED